jgi:hypothetical protein
VPPSSNGSFEDRTLRQIVHTSIPGNAVRVRPTNRFGTEPPVIGEAHVGRTATGATTDLVPGSDRTLRFGGRTSVTLGRTLERRNRRDEARPYPRLAVALAGDFDEI